MRIGVALGNLGLALRELPPPEVHADLVLRVAGEAERLGFHTVWVGDHVALPIEPTTPYPYGGGGLLAGQVSLLDPFAMLAAVAGRTERVRLGFGVVVLPLRHPIVVAKLVATIDALSHGRVVLGVGAGWLPEEFALVGADFARRGPHTDDALRRLRQVFADGEIDGMTVLPTPVQRPGPPVWIGGAGAPAVRRVVELGDVWDAPDPAPEALAAGIARLHAVCEQAGRDPATVGVAVRGLRAADVGPELIEAYAALGVGELGVRLPLGDPPRAFAALEDLAQRTGLYGSRHLD
jgi:probable F420-dependent oxidoreductase